jgi:cytoskeletal protein CcmA (bactofilin family)
MFGNNKNEEGKTKSTGLITPTSANSLNSIVKGTTIEGTVRSESDIRIDGTIKGKLFCDSKIILGPSGKVEGEINCQNAVIEGAFEGTIQVKDTLIIKEKAVISGDVTTDKLIIASGAIFNVNCNMGGKKSNKPFVNAKAAAKELKPANKPSEKASPLG